MLMEDPESAQHKPLPMIISASSEGSTGTVSILLKLNAGAFARAESIKAEMRGMLGQIGSGKGGEVSLPRTGLAKPQGQNRS